MQSNAETRRAATKDYVETISNYLQNSSQNGQGNFNPSGYSGSWNPDIGSPSYASSPTPSAITTAIASFGTSKYNSGDTAGYNRAYNEYYMPRYNAGKADGIGIARQYVQQVKSTLSGYSSSYVSSFYSGSTWNSGNSISATSPTPSQMASAITSLASDRYNSGYNSGYNNGKSVGEIAGKAEGLAVAKEYVTGIGEFLKGKGSAYTPAGYPGTSWNETSAKNPTPSQITAAIESYANSKVSKDLGTKHAVTYTDNGNFTIPTAGTGGYYSNVQVKVDVAKGGDGLAGDFIIRDNMLQQPYVHYVLTSRQTGAKTTTEPKVGNKSNGSFTHIYGDPQSYGFNVLGLYTGVRIEGFNDNNKKDARYEGKLSGIGPWAIGGNQKIHIKWRFLQAAGNLALFCIGDENTPYELLGIPDNSKTGLAGGSTERENYIENTLVPKFKTFKNTGASDRYCIAYWTSYTTSAEKKEQKNYLTQNWHDETWLIPDALKSKGYLYIWLFSFDATSNAVGANPDDGYQVLINGPIVYMQTCEFK